MEDKNTKFNYIETLFFGTNVEKQLLLNINIKTLLMNINEILIYINDPRNSTLKNTLGESSSLFDINLSPTSTQIPNDALLFKHTYMANTDKAFDCVTITDYGDEMDHPFYIRHVEGSDTFYFCCHYAEKTKNYQYSIFKQSSKNIVNFEAFTKHINQIVNDSKGSFDMRTQTASKNWNLLYIKPESESFTKDKTFMEYIVTNILKINYKLFMITMFSVYAIKTLNTIGRQDTNDVLIFMEIMLNRIRHHKIDVGDYGKIMHMVESTWLELYKFYCCRTSINIPNTNEILDLTNIPIKQLTNTIEYDVNKINNNKTLHIPLQATDVNGMITHMVNIFNNIKIQKTNDLVQIELDKIFAYIELIKMPLLILKHNTFDVNNISIHNINNLFSVANQWFNICNVPQIPYIHVYKFAYYILIDKIVATLSNDIVAQINTNKNTLINDFIISVNKTPIIDKYMYDDVEYIKSALQSVKIWYDDLGELENIYKKLYDIDNFNLKNTTTLQLCIKEGQSNNAIMYKNKQSDDKKVVDDFNELISLFNMGCIESVVDVNTKLIRTDVQYIRFNHTVMSLYAKQHLLYDNDILKKTQGIYTLLQMVHFCKEKSNEHYLSYHYPNYESLICKPTKDTYDLSQQEVEYGNISVFQKNMPYDYVETSSNIMSIDLLQYPQLKYINNFVKFLTTHDEYYLTINEIIPFLKYGNVSNTNNSAKSIQYLNPHNDKYASNNDMVIQKFEDESLYITKNIFENVVEQNKIKNLIDNVFNSNNISMSQISYNIFVFICLYLYGDTYISKINVDKLYKIDTDNDIKIINNMKSSPLARLMILSNAIKYNSNTDIAKVTKYFNVLLKYSQKQIIVINKPTQIDVTEQKINVTEKYITLSNKIFDATNNDKKPINDNDKIDDEHENDRVIKIGNQEIPIVIDYNVTFEAKDFVIRGITFSSFDHGREKVNTFVGKLTDACKKIHKLYDSETNTDDKKAILTDYVAVRRQLTYVRVLKNLLISLNNDNFATYQYDKSNRTDSFIKMRYNDDKHLTYMMPNTVLIKKITFRITPTHTEEMIMEELNKHTVKSFLKHLATLKTASEHKFSSLVNEYNEQFRYGYVYRTEENGGFMTQKLYDESSGKITELERKIKRDKVYKLNLTLGLKEAQTEAEKKKHEKNINTINGQIASQTEELERLQKGKFAWKNGSIKSVRDNKYNEIMNSMLSKYWTITTENATSEIPMPVLNITEDTNSKITYSAEPEGLIIDHIVNYIVTNNINVTNVDATQYHYDEELKQRVGTYINMNGRIKWVNIGSDGNIYIRAKYLYDILEFDDYVALFNKKYAKVSVNERTKQINGFEGKNTFTYEYREPQPSESKLVSDDNSNDKYGLIICHMVDYQYKSFLDKIVIGNNNITYKNSYTGILNKYVKCYMVGNVLYMHGPYNYDNTLMVTYFDWNNNQGKYNDNFPLYNVKYIPETNKLIKLGTEEEHVPIQNILTKKKNISVEYIKFIVNLLHLAKPDEIIVWMKDDKITNIDLYSCNINFEFKSNGVYIDKTLKIINSTDWKKQRWVANMFNLILVEDEITKKNYIYMLPISQHFKTKDVGTSNIVNFYKYFNITGSDDTTNKLMIKNNPSKKSHRIELNRVTHLPVINNNEVLKFLILTYLRYKNYNNIFELGMLIRKMNIEFNNKTGIDFYTLLTTIIHNRNTDLNDFKNIVLEYAVIRDIIKKSRVIKELPYLSLLLPMTRNQTITKVLFANYAEFEGQEQLLLDFELDKHANIKNYMKTIKNNTGEYFEKNQSINTDYEQTYKLLNDDINMMENVLLDQYYFNNNNKYMPTIAEYYAQTLMSNDDITIGGKIYKIADILFTVMFRKLEHLYNNEHGSDNAIEFNDIIAKIKQNDNKYKVNGFEFLYQAILGFVARKEQLEIIDDITRDINPNYIVKPEQSGGYSAFNKLNRFENQKFNDGKTYSSTINSLIMGGGKTSMITPLALIRYMQQRSTYKNEEGNNAYLILPNHLIKQSYEELISKISMYFPINVTIIQESRMDGNLADNKLKDGYSRTVDITKEKQIYPEMQLYITDDTSVKSGMINNYGTIIKNNKNNIYLFDEADTILDPMTSELNFPDKKTKTQLNNHSFGNYFDVIFCILCKIFKSRDKIVESIIAKYPNDYELNPHFNIINQNSALVSELCNYAKEYLINYYESRNSDIAKYLSGTINIKQYSQEQINTIYVLNNFINKSLPTVLFLINRKNYGLYEYVPEKYSKLEDKHVTIVPFAYANCPRENSRYSNPILILCLTIIEYLVQKIPLCDAILEVLINNFIEYRNNLPYHFRNIDPLIKKYAELNLPVLDDKISFKLFTEVHKNNLRNSVLFMAFICNHMCGKYIAFETEQQSITGVDLFMSFNIYNKSGFTGTPRIPEFYDIDENHKVIIKDVDEKSNSLIKSALENATVSDNYNSIKPPKELLDKIFNNEPEARVLIDIGAILLGVSVEEINDMVRAKHDIDQFIYWNKGDAMKIDRHKTHVVWDKVVTDKMFYYYDHRHTTGIHATIPSNTLGLALLGKASRYRDVVQGMYRMRKLNASLDKRHKIKFIINDKLSHQIKQITNTPQTTQMNINIMIDWFNIEENIYADKQQNFMKLQNIKAIERSNGIVQNAFTLSNEFIFPSLNDDNLADIISGRLTHQQTKINKIINQMESNQYLATNLFTNINVVQMTDGINIVINESHQEKDATQEQETQQEAQREAEAEQQQNVAKQTYAQLNINMMHVNNISDYVTNIENHDYYTQQPSYDSLYISKNVVHYKQPYMMLYDMANMKYFMIPFIEGIKIIDTLKSQHDKSYDDILICDTIENVYYNYNNKISNIDVEYITTIIHHIAKLFDYNSYTSIDNCINMVYVLNTEKYMLPNDMKQLLYDIHNVQIDNQKNDKVNEFFEKYKTMIYYYGYGDDNKHNINRAIMEDNITNSNAQDIYSFFTNNGQYMAYINKIKSLLAGLSTSS